MKKIKFAKEEDRDQKTLAKQYKRLEIFIIIFMSIAICFGTFYFNVICFGTECENKSPAPLVIINPGKASNNNKVVDKIKNGYWYNDGMILFFKDGNFSIGRYGTDGGHNGKLGEFKKTDEYTYEFTAAHEACTENCMTPSNAYTIEATLKYAATSSEEVVTITKMKKTEEGATEELTNYEETYKFVGNTWEEVETYVNNLNN